MSKGNLETVSKFVQTVTPAKAGVQNLLKTWIPAFAGMTNNGVCAILRHLLGGGSAYFGW